MNTNKKAITPIVATILLVVVAVILVTVILSWGKDFSNKSLSTADTEKLVKSNASEFVYTKAFSDGVIQFNYGPPDSLTNQNIIITGYKIFSDNNETSEIVLSSPYTLRQGQNILPLTSFSDQNITSRKMNIQLKTSDGKYIPLQNITNPYPYVPPVIEPCSIIPTNGQIYYLEHLDYIDTNATTLAGSYTLQRDLDFDDDDSYCQPATYKTTWTTGTGFTPIGTSSSGDLTFSFDGNNHTISNLYINRPTTDYIGLFGSENAVFRAQISNLILADINIFGRNYVGGLISRRISSNSITNNSVIGGAVSGNNYVAGVLGYNSGTALTNNYSDCNISGANYVGGLVGYNTDGGNLSYNSSSCNVSGANYVGGLVGYSDMSQISYNYSSGVVIGSGESIGGLCGFCYYIISNNYSVANVSGVNYVGGLVGSGEVGSIRKSYSKGLVSGSSSIGGLVGRTFGGFPSPITDSYYDTNTSGQSDNDVRGVPKTTSQMKTQSTFTDWDFNTIWNINAGTTYPYLRNNTQSPLPQ